MQRGRSRLLDSFYLVGSALLVCIMGLGAFAFAEVHHFSPLWVFSSLISIGFLAGVSEEYRKELRSAPFFAFTCGWILVNCLLVVTILGSLGWLYLVPALLLEQALFYLTAYWAFGLRHLCAIETAAHPEPTPNPRNTAAAAGGRRSRCEGPEAIPYKDLCRLVVWGQGSGIPESCTLQRDLCTFMVCSSKWR